MGEVMVRIIDIADTDSPAAVTIPPFHFDDAIIGGAYRDAITRKNIGPFMDSSSAPAAGIPTLSGNYGWSESERGMHAYLNQAVRNAGIPLLFQ